MLSNEELDMDQAILIDKNCNCTLHITYRMLIEIALKPVISNIANIISSTLASNDLFGLYGVAVLIITSKSKEIASNMYDSILKESIYRHLKVHQKRPAVFFSQEEVIDCKTLGNWISDVKQIFGRGSYLQLSDTRYMIRFRSNNKVENNDFIIFEKGDYLGHKGVNKILVPDISGSSSLGKPLYIYISSFSSKLIISFHFKKS